MKEDREHVEWEMKVVVVMAHTHTHTTNANTHSARENRIGKKILKLSGHKFALQIRKTYNNNQITINKFIFLFVKLIPAE